MMMHGGGKRPRRRPTPGASIGSVVAVMNDLTEGTPPLVRQDLTDTRKLVTAARFNAAIDVLVTGRRAQALVGLDIGPYKTAMHEVCTLAYRHAKTLYDVERLRQSMQEFSSEVDAGRFVRTLQKNLS